MLQIWITNNTYIFFKEINNKWASYCIRSSSLNIQGLTEQWGLGRHWTGCMGKMPQPTRMSLQLGGVTKAQCLEQGPRAKFWAPDLWMWSPKVPLVSHSPNLAYLELAQRHLSSTQYWSMKKLLRFSFLHTFLLEHSWHHTASLHLDGFPLQR